MSSLPVRTLAKSVLILVALMLAGCGGGPGPNPEDPGRVLARYGLTARVLTDKKEYQRGEQVHIWLDIENEGNQVRRLDAYVDTVGGYPTYSSHISRASDRFGVWNARGDEPISRLVQPGETVRIVGLVWDQTSNTVNAVEPGLYFVSIRLSNVWLDGGRLRDRHGFAVSVEGEVAVQLIWDEAAH